MRIIGKKSHGVQTRSKFLIFVEDIANLAVSVKKNHQLLCSCCRSCRCILKDFT